MRQCLSCGEDFEGRAGKKFCSSYCRSAYHYRNKQADSLFQQIDRQLKQNRQILKKYNQAGKATVRQEVLLKEGFNPRYFTHFWKAQNGNVYLFCYEFGFFKKSENGKTKYVLIQWQPYME
jgi:hypothetical protein